MTFTLIFENKKEDKELIKDVTTIQDILEGLCLSSETIIAKKNGEIVIEDEIIENGDEIQLIQILYGG
ncbi:sulfur carrier protein ThiS [Methanobrevibacter cuticularis]|uniref:Sulfur carrier protein ThiS n=1 Tax=Methanobrevibacter cuticularis TaxID=47311 RepID=A0A166ER16_9EURY|nr:MoaD/ThiS family protein [Methanobrevibacter cuticularis]KZX16918.1 sulfur carrier protein ThiS [Methanobrevibacter cuticularis]